MVEAMLWVLRTGAPWRDLPSAYGPWKSVYTRFSRWSAQGVLARLFEALARERDAEGYLLDATIVRAHQDASGAAKEGALVPVRVPRNKALARRFTPLRSVALRGLRRLRPLRVVHEGPRARRRAG
jgi:transposase